MRSNHFYLLLFFLCSTILLNAQNKDFTIKQAIMANGLRAESISQLQWVDDVTYSHISKKDPLKMEIHSLAESFPRSITTKDLDNALSKYDANWDSEKDSLKRFPRISWINNNQFRFYRKGEFIVYSIKSKSLQKLISYNPRSMASPDFHKKSNQIAYVQNHNLYIQNKDTFIQITKDGKDGLEYGQAVHRYEFGIVKGTFWSPSGSKLAFYKKDESMVTQYPMYSLADTPATANMVYYPTAGAKSHHASLGIYNVKTSKTIYLKTKGPKEQYLTNISWGPKGEFIYVAEVNRAQNHMWLNKYSALTGDFVKTLFEEKNDRYVEPEHPMLFLEGRDQFIWWSERDGFNHLYLYNNDGSLEKQLTKGNWVVTEYLGFNKDYSELFIVGTKENGIERHVYCVGVKNGKVKKLTKNPGMHRVQMNSAKTLFINRFSNTVNPGQINIVSSKGKIAKELHQADNPLKGYNLANMTIGTLKSEDGHDLYYRLFKPTNFDPNKKYPVVVYLYNGPHAQLITNSWNGGANLWYHYMAQKGYAVFTIDGRGSANRGFEFESVIHRNVAHHEMNDQMVGVDYLKGLNWVDSTRMGIHGWSYGGFMTTSIMSRKPGIFKVGVAGGPVIDWNYYEIMYTERYMDSPQENPEGYKNTSLLNYIPNLEGRLLMIHGSQDQTVLWQHSMLYLQKAIRQGKQLDYFIYPHHAHNVRGSERVHLYEKISQYFFDFL